MVSELTTIMSLFEAFMSCVGWNILIFPYPHYQYLYFPGTVMLIHIYQLSADYFPDKLHLS